MNYSIRQLQTASNVAPVWAVFLGPRNVRMFRSKAAAQADCHERNVALAAKLAADWGVDA